MKTSELTGAALDWAVAKCEGEDYLAEPEYDGIGNRYASTSYSTNWAQGGPIIERGRISLYEIADIWKADIPGMQLSRSGPTPLIAAMHCYVASKLGDDVEVPDELH